MVLNDAGFLISNSIFLAKLPHKFSSAYCARAVGILMSQFGACSVRISGDRLTDKCTHIERHTDQIP